MRKATRITTLASEESMLIASLTQLTYDAFKQPAPSWLPTLAHAQRQVLNALASDRICRVLLDANDNPLGWIAAIPLHHGRIWEIHPLVVAVAEQGKGYGRALVKEIERLAQQKGVLGLSVGTSDETGATTLYGVDLYQNPLAALAHLQSHQPHPYEFWIKMGFTVVGVVPDVDGRGKPGIHLAKRVAD